MFTGAARHAAVIGLVYASIALTEKKMPQVTRQQVSRVLRELLPCRHWSVVDLLEWMQEMQLRHAQ